MSQDPELDLLVVGGDEAEPGGGHEGRPQRDRARGQGDRGLGYGLEILILVRLNLRFMGINCIISP